MINDRRSIGPMMLKEDVQFLNAGLSKVPRNRAADIKARYKEEFLAGHDGEPASHRKENAGRQRANLWLLDVMKGHDLMGIVAKMEKDAKRKYYINNR